MNDAILDDLAIEKTCKERFGVAVDVTDVIVRAVPAGVATRATIFVTTNRHVYAYIVSQSSMVLDDVRKIIRRMECEADVFVPPYGEPDYFDRIGRTKFKAMFPGKPILGEDDLRYYKNLASYNPALVRLSKIKGEIRGFEVESKSWRKVKDYAYNKIKPA
jgi:hypothetical protein